jgi:lysophospholipase L1-like esterase
VCTGTSGKAVAVHLIGDSTMSIYASDLYPRMGWGQPLGELFDPACATVKDWAASGRSSKSFFDEGKWTPVRDGLAAGDYVLIQFGHNDEKTDDPARYTEPQTTFKQYLTTYIEEAREKQATPMLLTPIHRNNWTGATIKDTHGGYPAAMRELAAALEVELVDLTALTQEYFERIGQVETTKLFLVLAAGEFPNYPDGNTDNTHLQEYGARKIGQLAMANAYAQGLTLGSYLSAVPVAP